MVAHGPELEDLEWFHTLSKTFLPEEDRTFGINLDADGYDSHGDAAQQQATTGKRDINNSLKEITI